MCSPSGSLLAFSKAHSFEMDLHSNGNLIERPFYYQTYGMKICRIGVTD